MNETRLTEELASSVMNWKVAPDRFIRSGRSWIPRWRFRPFDDVEAAIQLLERATDGFSLTSDRRAFTAIVQIGGNYGKATGKELARTVVTALCRGLGIQI